MQQFFRRLALFNKSKRGEISFASPLLYSLSYRMLGNKEEAEEAVQKIFLRVYRSLYKFRLSDRFYPWLYTTAINWLRSKKKRR